MGEMAEMMLDGTLCEACGSFIDEDGAEGFPRYCSNRCARDRGATHALLHAVIAPNPSKTNCGVCGKRVKKSGLADHMRDAHQATATRAMQIEIAAQALLDAMGGDTPDWLRSEAQALANAMGAK